jgi:hypothetical protein
MNKTPAAGNSLAAGSFPRIEAREDAASGVNRNGVMKLELQRTP